MKSFNFVTDIAIESANISTLSEYCEEKMLSYGILKRTLNINTLAKSKEIGKPCGKYITYDCNRTIYDNKNAQVALSKYICASVRNLIGTVKKSTPLFVVGLGNKNIVADSLGQKTVDGVSITRHLSQKPGVQSVCALSTGVLGTTGIQSVDILKGIVDRIKPCAVIVVDSLATSVVSRVGHSFQISSAGITPGSGIGQDKERIDKSVLGVPVISIGVPMMLSLRCALYNLVVNYSKSIDKEVNQFELRKQLDDSNLINLVVSPKEVDFFVEKCADIICRAINALFA